MHLDAVEARLLRHRRGVPVVADQTWNLVGSKRARHRGGCLRAVLEEDQFTGLDGRGRDGRLAMLLKADMGHAPDMPELAHDPPSGLVHGRGDARPSLGLRLRVDARREGVASALS